MFWLIIILNYLFSYVINLNLFIADIEVIRLKEINFLRQALNFGFGTDHFLKHGIHLITHRANLLLYQLKSKVLLITPIMLHLLEAVLYFFK